MNRTIYTVGHSTQSMESFINLLKKNNITCIVDVRSIPFSKFASQFNQNEIRLALKNVGIQYVHMGDEFGARREDKSLYDVDGRLDFEKTAECQLMKQGMNRISNGLEKGFNIALMCTEKDPKDCHRCILVGRTFSEAGYDVENILADGSLKSQKKVEEELINKYFPDRMQVSMFDMGNTFDYRTEAYRKRAKEIAYNINNIDSENKEENI